MKKIKNIFLYIGSILLLGISVSAYAAGIVDIGDSGKIENIVFFSSHGNLLNTIWLVAEKVIRFARFALNGIALLAMLYVGFLWVTSMGDEEKTSDGKNRILLVVLGLFLINIPEALYRIITGNSYRTDGFDRKVSDVQNQLSTGVHATSISENSADKCNFLFCSQNFSGTILPTLEVIMLVVAVFMFTIGGFKMLFGGNEESSDSAKKRIGYGVIALLVTGFLEMIYRAMFFQSDLNGVANKVTDVLTQMAKFFIYLAGPIAIICIILGGYYFITSGGDEEKTDKGKKILMYTFFATIMLLLGYTFLIEIVGLTLF